MSVGFSYNRSTNLFVGLRVNATNQKVVNGAGENRERKIRVESAKKCFR